MKNVMGWVFTYNDYTKTWMAATRENAPLMFNDFNSDKVIKSKSIDTLIEILRKTKGNPKEFKI
jgi:hypothetical protein